MLNLKVISVCTLITFCLLSVAFAADPPDAVVHPVSGDVEIAESVDDGGDMDIEHTVDTGRGPGTSALLTTSGDDDHAPRVEFDSVTKDLYLAWWREESSGDGIFVRVRDDSTGLWATEQRVSDPTQSARNPEIAFDGVDLWIAYEVDASAGTDIAAGVSDGSSPWLSHTVLGQSTFGGVVDVIAHAESSKAWVTWVQNGTEVGWSEYDRPTDTWSTTQYESYAADSIELARKRVRDTVLAP